MEDNNQNDDPTPTSRVDMMRLKMSIPTVSKICLALICFGLLLLLLPNDSMKSTLKSKASQQPREAVEIDIPPFSDASLEKPSELTVSNRYSILNEEDTKITLIQLMEKDCHEPIGAIMGTEQKKDKFPSKVINVGK